MEANENFGSVGCGPILQYINSSHWTTKSRSLAWDFHFSVVSIALYTEQPRVCTWWSRHCAYQQSPEPSGTLCNILTLALFLFIFIFSSLKSNFKFPSLSIFNFLDSHVKPFAFLFNCLQLCFLSCVLYFVEQSFLLLCAPEMAATTAASFSGISLFPPSPHQSNRNVLPLPSLSFPAKRNSLKSLLLKRSGVGYESISRSRRSFVVRCNASNGRVSICLFLYSGALCLVYCC